jgi:hypothetical protein
MTEAFGTDVPSILMDNRGRDLDAEIAESHLASGRDQHPIHLPPPLRTKSIASTNAVAAAKTT